MPDESLNFLLFAVFFGTPFAIVGALVVRAHRAGKLNKASVFMPVDTLPAYNMDGTPMIPGSSFDVTGSPYGSGPSY